MTISGIDIASYQGIVGMDALAQAGCAFVVSKATEGVDYLNPFFGRNWFTAKAAGLVRGAYHYAQPDANQPSDEAAWFLRQLAAVGGLEPGDFVVLDIETGTGDLLAWTLTWLQTVEAALGFKPILYSGLWFMQPHNLVGSADLGRYGLWIAAYQATAPAAPAPWEFWCLWQNSATGTVPGVVGECDTDVFNGDRDHLLLYGKPAPPPKPVPTNDDLEQLHRLVDAEPFDAGALVTYAGKFA